MDNKDPAFPVQLFFFFKPDGTDFNFIVEVMVSFLSLCITDK